MPNITGLLHRLRVLLAPRSYAREVEREIAFHLELEAMQQRARGASSAAADAAAHRTFGNVTFAREEVRRMTAMRMMDRVRQDLRYAVRGLVARPAFTVAVALTLGMGLGVNLAIVDFLDRVFVRPPAGVTSPDDVRRLYIQANRGDGLSTWNDFRYPQIRAIVRTVDSTVSIGIFTAASDSTTAIVGAERITLQRTFANAAFFRVLGVRPALGRMFDSTEDRIDVWSPVAIISHDLWLRRFGGTADVVGSTVRIDDRPVTVIGIAPEGFSGIELDRTDVWMPAGNLGGDKPRKVPWYESYVDDFNVVTRVSDAVTERRFVAAATRAYRGVQIPDWGQDSIATIVSGPILSALGPGERGQEVSIALRLGGVSCLVLLIALANVSNLLLVRAARRGREIAVRRALGASRQRLLEQFLTESLLLAVVSLAVSFTLAFWAGAALRRLLLPKIHWATGPLDARTMWVAITATIVSGLVIGLAPALQAWRSGVVSSLAAGTRERGGFRQSRVTSALIVVQSALSVVLLVGAGLFVRSLLQVRAANVGYDVDRTVLAWPLSSEGRPLKSLQALVPQILSRLARIPGVEVVAAASQGPMSGVRFGPFALPGRATVPVVGGEALPGYIDVTPGYFDAVGMRVLAGRTFSHADHAGIVVGETMAKSYWPGASPLGQCVILVERGGGCTRVIGVVSDVNRFRILEKKWPAQYYTSNADEPHRMFVVRSAAGNARSVSAQVTTVLRSMLPEAGIMRVSTIRESLEPQYRPWRLGAILFTGMGALALVVAAIGMYSVIAYAASQRTSEMGIRIALGARIADIAKLVIGDGLRTVAVGIVLGVVLSLSMASLVASVLYGVSARDPLAIAVAAMILAAIGLAASVIPAVRAARVSPVEALRAE